MSDSDTPRLRKHFTFDEIVGMFSDIADDKDDPDRFKALKFLTTLNASVAAIPAPESSLQSHP